MRVVFKLPLPRALPRATAPFGNGRKATLTPEHGATGQRKDRNERKVPATIIATLENLGQDLSKRSVPVLYPNSYSNKAFWPV
jgi:hypothetical protein